ncbi:MAG TPA: helix-turn-helix domain-containing protein [Candidatus Sulfopaludibacter sp.]|nr:helix-turn-helix domain-containing protein [Candidatus Sulfopaludibacter sp.]
MPEFLSVDQAAEELGIKPVSVRALIRSGVLPASRFNSRTWQIARADLEAARNRRKPGWPPRKPRAPQS